MDMDAGETAPSGRHETPAERLDRKWNDQLQELRVMQTGAQLLAGFLLTLPFQETFGDLDDVQRTTYLALVALAALTTLLVLGPVAIHRRLTGLHVKERVVATTHRLMAGVLTCLALLVSGMTFFLYDVVADRATGIVAGLVVALLAVSLLVVMPHALRDRADDDESDAQDEAAAREGTGADLGRRE